MAQSFHKRLNKFIMIAAICFTAISVAYAAMPVIDNSNLAQAIKQLSTLGKQLSELKNVVTQVTKMTGALGKDKAHVGYNPTSWNTSVPIQTGNALPNYNEWKLPKDVSPTPTVNIQTGAQILKQAFDTPLDKNGKPKTATMEMQHAINQSRETANKEVIYRALAIAQNAEATARNSATAAEDLLTQPNSDLREQTALLLHAVTGVHQELVQMRVVMAAMLELQAMKEAIGIPYGAAIAAAPMQFKEPGEQNPDSPFNPPAAQ